MRYHGIGAFPHRVRKSKWKADSEQKFSRSSSHRALGRAHKRKVQKYELGLVFFNKVILSATAGYDVKMLSLAADKGNQRPSQSFCPMPKHGTAFANRSRCVLIPSRLFYKFLIQISQGAAIFL